MTLKVENTLALSVRNLDQLPAVDGLRVTRQAEALMLDWIRPDGGRSGQWFQIHPRPCPLGGAALSLVCGCGKRVQAVYLNPPKDTWACRHCLGLRYASQAVHYHSGGQVNGSLQRD